MDENYFTNHGLRAGQQGTGNDKCSCVLCSPKDVPRDQEAMMESGQASAQGSQGGGVSEIPLLLGSTVLGDQVQQEHQGDSGSPAGGGPQAPGPRQQESRIRVYISCCT